MWFCLGNIVGFAVLHNIINRLIINNKTVFNQTKNSNGCMVPLNKKLKSFITLKLYIKFKNIHKYLLL